MLSRDDLRQLRAIEQELDGWNPQLSSIMSGRPEYEQRQMIRPVALGMLVLNSAAIVASICSGNLLVGLCSGILAAFNGWLLRGP